MQLRGDARGPVRPTGISRGRPASIKERTSKASLSVSMAYLFRNVTRYERYEEDTEKGESNRGFCETDRNHVLCEQNVPCANG